jgi:hypothetical protein
VVSSNTRKRQSSMQNVGDGGAGAGRIGLKTTHF